MLGDHGVVLPNSIVASDVESYTMVGGGPAQVVGGSAGEKRVPPGRTPF